LSFLPAVPLEPCTVRQPVQLWDVATGELVATPLAGNQDVEKYDVHSFVSSPDGKLLAFVDRVGEVYVKVTSQLVP
jgi:hypothetical protein